jgi:hypothetical protein
MIPILVSVLRAVKKGMEKATHHKSGRNTYKVTPYKQVKTDNKTNNNSKKSGNP